MISPLKRMATTAVKKLKDLSGDGKVTQKDVLIGRGVINPDGTKLKSPNKIMGGMSSITKSKLPLKTDKEVYNMGSSEQAEYANSSSERKKQVNKLGSIDVAEIKFSPEGSVETKDKVKSKTVVKKPEKLTGAKRRKAERNIKAQEKANKRIRKAGGQQIKVDQRNVTATAADRRKLTQGAKQLEKKLSLAQKEKDRKKEKENKNKNRSRISVGFSSG